jgi:hypothetical protein
LLYQLNVLGIRAEDGPSASKLQVYREAFSYFMEDFKTYKPLLSAIKNEYELLLDKYISRLHYIPPLKARLSTLTQETQQKMNELNSSHKVVKDELESMKEELENSNSKLISDNSTLQQENADLNKEILNIRRKYDEMVVNNKALMNSLTRKAEEAEKNEMRNDKHDAAVSKLQSQITEEQAEKSKLNQQLQEIVDQQRDLLTKEKAEELKRTSDDLQQRLLETEAELVQERTKLKTMQDMQGAMQGMQGAGAASANTNAAAAVRKGGGTAHAAALDWGSLLARHSLQMQTPPQERAMEDVVNDLLQVIAIQQTVLTESDIEIPGVLAPNSGAAGDSTFLTTGAETDLDHHEGASDGQESKGGRPIYLIPCHVHGEQGMEVQEEHSAAGVSEEVAVLRKPNQTGRKGAAARKVGALGGLFKPAGPYIEGRGIGNEVPNFLKLHGHVRNLKLSKREAEKVVQECWKKKDEAEEKLQRPLPLVDFFFEFMKTKHGTQAAVAECSYNLLDALNRYCYSTDCLMFLKMIESQLSEHFRKDELETFRHLYNCLKDRDKDASASGKETGKISTSDFSKAMRKAFPHKDEDSLAMAQKAIGFDSHGAIVAYSTILAFAAPNRKSTVNAGANTKLHLSNSKFVSVLREQNLEEALEFLESIKEALQREDHKHGATNMLTVPRLRSSLTQVDPFKSSREIDELLARGCGCTMKQLSEQGTEKRFNIDTFMKALATSGVVKKSAPL